MLAFVIPLRSKFVSSSWHRVCQLLERTLKSVCNQTSSNFKVIVVCHEKPDIIFQSSHVTYLIVDFPPPQVHFEGKQRDNASSLIHANKNTDKNRKILTGLLEAQKMNCSHVMIVDSDDCVSKRIAEFVERNQSHNGWYIGSGYEYEENSNYIRRRKRNLYKKTGTSNIVRLDLLKKDMETPLENINNYFLHHQDIVDILSQRGTPLNLLPFEGTVYITETGENNWAQKSLFWQRKITAKRLFKFYSGIIYKLLITRPLTQSIRDEFGIYDLLLSSS